MKNHTLRLGRPALAAVLAGGIMLATGTPALAERKPLLGPTGYGSVKLGMTAAQARATGKLVRKSVRGSLPTCTTWDLKEQRYGDNRAGVFISKKHGVVAIAAPGSVRTPQGIGRGSTVAQLRRAYPDFRLDADGPIAGVPGNRKATYVFHISKTKVLGVAIYLKKQDCFK
ncbi:hypothetical protein HD597_010486 [Nonomuraea thailandensis]|uniref:Uncharacterized protein n=1 Tax=Nonomuraea thailandensis TaxID=1188745 RepID=A0A9X2GX93_9ACTN|nr:hypothetical protein [Nonomuraea thailandensis]MCP2363466.1 hypothetical protein [Nonomuraea thailandensis]